MALHLLVGDPEDSCCLSVERALISKNYPTCIVANPLAYPAFLTWRLDSKTSASKLSWDGNSPVSNEDIAGVFVRRVACVDPTGWSSDDLAYVYAEMQAGLLAWLWSLNCPVINRYPPAIWYRARAPLLSWHSLLKRCQLPTLPTLVTNVPEEARAFGELLSAEGMPGAVYGSLTGDARYLVSGKEDWAGLAAMQRHAPVSLAAPYGAAQFACVVGKKVIWAGEPPRELLALEPGLCCFAEATGLAFVELAFAASAGRMCVIAVEPYPQLERFGEVAGAQIVETLVDLLTADVHNRRDVDGQRPRSVI